MNNIKRIMIKPEDAGTLDELSNYLNGEESINDREIVDVGLAQSPTGRFNIAGYQVNTKVMALPRIEVLPISDANAESELKSALSTRTAISYTPFLIGGQERRILVARAGLSIKFEGKMSTFGGPQDSGMSATEGLALIQKSHLPQFLDYFLNGTTLPRGRSLNPATHYIACRWDSNVTPYPWLRNHRVIVRNPLTGKFLEAQPMDWGPSATTGRVADLSPGLAQALKLETDDLCEVIVPIPATPVAAVVGVTDQHQALVDIARRQHNLYSKCDENQEPLHGRIKAYWEETQDVTGAGFPASGVEVPWSAIFICWCLKNAGATAGEFHFSPQHSVYVHRCIANAKAGQGSFRAFPIDSYAPKLGDIVHHYRGSGQLTYEQAADDDDYPSHCAVVVGFEDGPQGKAALTIGGNESDSIRLHRVALTNTGMVRQRSRHPFVSVIRTFDSAAV